MNAVQSKQASHLLPSMAVALCGAVWGGFWVPLHWFASEGVGGAWVALIFNAMAMFSALPWLLRRDAWAGAADQALSGLLLGTAFSLYTVSLVLTDVVHSILLFYLTPVWSTLAGRFFLRQRLSPSRILAMVMGFAGLASVLGFKDGIPLPRNWGDGLALVSGMLWAAGTLRSFHRPTRKVAMSVFSFAAGGCLSSALILAAAAALALPLAEPGHLRDMLPWIILLGLIIFVPPNFLVLWAAQRIDSARVGILLMTEVLFGTLSAGLLSGQPFTLAEGLGTALIVSAGLIEVIRR
ncbi:MAG: DMT family transporter [Verrucomicrobiaceae bacterium]|uniref:DMT family transporter n=1 Tax=Aestuariivirga sp. TaxID=2650926 RepID=UPI00301B0068